MKKINPSATSPTVRELRQAAFEALIALHQADPAVVHELANNLDYWASVHTALQPLVACTACDVKRSTAALLRSVATLRELVTSSTVPAPEA